MRCWKKRAAILILVMAIMVLLITCVVLGSACGGEEGEQGTDEVAIQNIVNNGDGTFTVNLTNGEKYTTDNLTGPDGSDTDIGLSGLPFSVVVVNQDEGYAIPPSNASVSLSKAIISSLDSAIVEVERVNTEAEGVELVESGEAYGVIIFPKDFTYNVYRNMIDPFPALDTKIRVRLDNGNLCVAWAIKEEV
jgi:hypothetical protein